MKEELKIELLSQGLTNETANKLVEFITDSNWSSIDDAILTVQQLYIDYHLKTCTYLKDKFDITCRLATLEECSKTALINIGGIAAEFISDTEYNYLIANGYLYVSALENDSVLFVLREGNVCAKILREYNLKELCGNLL